MKRRTLLIFIVIISLLIAVPAHASTITIDESAKPQGSSPIHQVLNRNLEDIINIPPDGHHDNFEGLQNQYFCRAEGWAADPDDRSLDLNVRIFSDGVEVAQTIAETFRQDLADAGVCQDGTCSFSVDLWGLISTGADHSIIAQAQDAQTGEWSNLYDTPRTLNCFEAQAQTFIVNSTADLGDAIQGNGVCETSIPAECTLRAAIIESNANPGTDTINFEIPTAGPYTISPSYSFDFVFDPVTIDATTQPGFNGTPIIELDGSHAGPDGFGIVIFAGSSTVRGLVINRFALTGIDLDVNGGNTIQGNYIGTDITGTIGLGNGLNGIAISQGSSSNLIGGTTAGTGNIISGNGQSGIAIVDPGSVSNVIQGNRIGTDVTGQSGLGNADDGVLLLAPNNTIGGTTPEARNIISGNQEQGIRMQGSEASGNIVQGNFIGVDSTGTVALGNGTDCCHSGVVLHLGASNNTIGGNVPGAGNVISGNTADGVTIMDAGTTGNLVAGNFIGTDTTGTKGVANSLNGIDIFDGAGDNMVGGTINGAGNTIAFNNANGVVLAMSSGTGNAILSNAIHSNSGLGIDLGDDGVTLNDFFDADSGPNNLQNFPVLIQAVETRKKGTLLHGALITTGNTSLRLEFFSNEACDASGYGEGQTYLGFTEVKANPTGLAKFKFRLPASLPNGSFITATATDSANNTSELSQCLQATP